MVSTDEVVVSIKMCALTYKQRKYEMPNEAALADEKAVPINSVALCLSTEKI